MQSLKIGRNEAGQRIDKMLLKYLSASGKSFIYKMLRKKNITLNGARCTGSELLKENDLVTLWLSDDTIRKFSAGKETDGRKKPAVNPAHMPEIIYEDEHILILNKPAEMLSQKSRPDDVSVNEYVIWHLIQNGSLTEEDMRSFMPSVCNRLDRNTSGLIIAGKTLSGLQVMSEAIRDRKLRKEYLTIVKGTMDRSGKIKGYLKKDERSNKVSITETEEAGSDPVETEFFPLLTEKGMTFLKVHLITGKTHQIRAHLSSIGHPVAGDPKYGDPGWNRELLKQYGIRFQLLHSWHVVMPDLKEPLSSLSGKEFRAALPEAYGKVMKEIRWEHGKAEV
jgi:23S rRNA pseudouridine955/2504/2580 synthase